jgi:ATP-dependent Zn protease
MGLRSPLKHMAPEAKRRLAYYQAGKAVAVRLFLPHYRISRITIIRQGSHFGHVLAYSARESYEGLQIKPELLERVKVQIAGKATEIEFCGVENQSVLVGRDLERVYNILGAMANAGMFETMGATTGYSFDIMQGVRVKWTAEQSRAIEEIYQQVLRDTRIALRQHAEVVNALVELLLEKEELMADELRDFFDQYGLYTPDPTIVRDGEEFHLFETPQRPELPAGAAGD